MMPRSNNQRLATALTLCVGVGGQMEAAARATLAELQRRFVTPERIARELGVTPKTVRGIVKAYEEARAA